MVHCSRTSMYAALRSSKISLFCLSLATEKAASTRSFFERFLRGGRAYKAYDVLGKGQRALTRIPKSLSTSREFFVKCKYPAKATIAPLSVQNSGLGKKTRYWCSDAMLFRVFRRALLAPTPPAITNCCIPVCARAR